MGSRHYNTLASKEKNQVVDEERVSMKKMKKKNAMGL